MYRFRDGTMGMSSFSSRLQFGVVGRVLVGPKLIIQPVSSSSCLMPGTNRNFPVIIIKSALTMGGTHSDESVIAIERRCHFLPNSYAMMRMSQGL